MKKLIATLLVTLLLAACIARPGALMVGPGRGAAPRSAASGGASAFAAITGRVVFARSTASGYHVQATAADVGNGATVSLINANTGVTAATSLSDSSGNFSMQFTGNFSPSADPATTSISVPYYLEAIKGVQGPNTQFNQAGADAVRVRTMIWWDFQHNGWVSLTSASASTPVTISDSTTAVSIFLNTQMVNGLAEKPSDYIGCIDPLDAATAPADYGIPVGTQVDDLSQSTYSNLYWAVVTAITNNEDPIHYLVASNSGTVVNTDTSLAVTGITPTVGPIGTTVTITGKNMTPSQVNVSLGGALATVNQTLSASNSLVVNVPPGAHTGMFEVELNGVQTFSPQTFTVTTTDGHVTTYTDSNGNTSLYAGSSDIGTLVRVNPDGSTTTISTSFSKPMAVLVDPEQVARPPFHVYVADDGTNEIVQATDNGGSTPATIDGASFLAATDPHAMVEGPDGDLYVAETSAGQILRASVNWSAGTVINADVATYTGFSDPTALAFDPSGNLHVIETQLSGQNYGEELSFKPGPTDSGSSAPATQWNAYITDPEGIAIDTFGNSYVTSPSENAIYKVDPWNNTTAYLSTNGPQAISQDTAGNLYFTDTTRNLIRRVTPAGDQRIYAYGLSALKGLAVDGSSNVYVALNTSGAILKISSDGVTTSPLISGISEPYGLRYRNSNIYVAQTDTDSVTQVALNGTATSVIPGGLTYPGGVDYDPSTSTFYVGRYGPTDAYAALRGSDGMWGLEPNGGIFLGTGGVDVVTNGGSTITPRFPLMDLLTPDWNNLAEGIAEIGSGTGTLVFTVRDQKKLYETKALPGGASSQQIDDVTPSFGGTRAFPGTVNDVVYDGTQYVYVACSDGNIYRLDATTFNNSGGTSVAAIGPFPTGGYPYGLTLMGGNLYAVDRGRQTVVRVLNPATASGIDGTWSPQVPLETNANLEGITNFGGNLFIADYGNSQVEEIPSGSSTPQVYVSGLNGARAGSSRTATEGCWSAAATACCTGSRPERLRPLPRAGRRSVAPAAVSRTSTSTRAVVTRSTGHSHTRPTWPTRGAFTTRTRWSSIPPRPRANGSTWPTRTACTGSTSPRATRSACRTWARSRG